MYPYYCLSIPASFKSFPHKANNSPTENQSTFGPKFSKFGYARHAKVKDRCVAGKFCSCLPVPTKSPSLIIRNMIDAMVEVSKQ